LIDNVFHFDDSSMKVQLFLWALSGSMERRKDPVFQQYPFLWAISLLV